MKNLGKALKIYIRMSLNPIVSLLGVFIMVTLLAAAAISPEAKDGKDYMSMITAVGFGQIGILAFCMFGGITISRSKYFVSLPFAKTLFTTAPVIISAVLSLIYATAAIIIAVTYWEPAALSDLLIILPINSVMIGFAVSSIGKPKMQITYIICLLFLTFQQTALPKIGFTAHGFGLPAQIAGVIGAAIFIAGIALAFLSMDLWWKKCDRTFRSNPNYGIKLTR